MIYATVKKVINNYIKKLEEGYITQDEYNKFADDYAKKLDVFLLCDRITDTQYQELMTLLKHDVEPAA